MHSDNKDKRAGSGKSGISLPGEAKLRAAQAAPRAGEMAEDREAAQAAQAARTQQALQLMEKENGQLVASLEGELDDVRKVETRMRQVHELMQTFSVKIAEQTESVQAIEQSTEEAVEKVDDGYETLVRAAKRQRSMRHGYVTITLLLAFLLLLLDLYFP